jgi:hypothetical protein
VARIDILAYEQKPARLRSQRLAKPATTTASFAAS